MTMEHFPMGIAVDREAIEIPDWAVDGLIEMRDDQIERTYEIFDDHVIHKDSGVVWPYDTYIKWPVRVHPHYPPVELPRTQQFTDFWVETERKIYESVLEYLKTYPLLIYSLWWRDKGHSLIYEPGASLEPHQDNNVGYSWSNRKDIIGRTEMSTRNVLSTTLHVVDCEGGDMHFPYAGVTIPPRRGDVVIFPANYVAAHEVTTVKEGSRRISYLGWFGQGSAEPLSTPVGESDSVVAGIYDPDESPEATLLWQKYIERDFVESCGWSEEKLRRICPWLGHQAVPVYWEKFNE